MSRRLWTVAFLSVPFLACTAIVVVPLRSSLYYSFTDRNGFNARCHWIGLENFLRTPRDILLANTVMDTAIWMAAATVVPTGGRLAMVIFLPGLTLGAAKG